MEDEINKEYIGDKPHSFGGKYRLYDVYDNGRVDKALHKSDIYSKFKQHRRAKTYSPIYVYKKREVSHRLVPLGSTVLPAKFTFPPKTPPNTRWQCSQLERLQ